ncbi:Alpha/Beta hydrolase protein [Paraphysoderma sedebokerense]|nr:Alpha/Beta hydrolase protein [Paraphysoderma sedebokerense]
MPFVTVGKNRREPNPTPVNLYYELHFKGKTKLNDGSGESVSVQSDQTIQESRKKKHKILFIMGLNTNGSAWKFQVEYFSKFDDFVAVTFDNRGVGHSDAPPGRYRTSDMAMDAYDLVKHLGWDKVHVVGVSMGGMIAQEFAVNYPEMTLSVALTSTHAGFAIPPMRGAVLLTVNTVHQVVRPNLVTRTRNIIRILYPESFLKSEAPEGSRTMQEYLEEFHHQNLTASPAQQLNGIKGQFAAVLTHYVSKDRLMTIKSNKIPVVVITGTDDVLIHHRNSLYLSKMLAAPLYILEGVGHAVGMQQKEEYNRILRRHFKHAWEDFEERMDAEDRD